MAKFLKHFLTNVTSCEIKNQKRFRMIPKL